MSGNPELASLTRWLHELQREVRGLATGNALQQGSVEDAAGRIVPLSSLAFGQVAARDAATLILTTNSPAWIPGAPALDVHVRGGRLRIDLAGRLNVMGVNLWLAMSYGLAGPTSGPGPGGGQVRAPDDDRALIVKNNGAGISTEIAAGFADFAEGLAPGWYRVTAYYRLTGEVQQFPEETWGAATNRRLIASPY